MKYFLIAGERSGDLHGSNLIKALRKKDPEAEFWCWGGDAMEAAGATLRTHYREMAVMGLWEVITKLFTILKYLRQCHEDILNYQPDAVILIDFGGFNLRMAKKLAGYGIPVHYYISPKIWAWNTSRAKKIKKYIDKMYCILPFEKEFYQKFDMEVDYVGNPVRDAVSNFEPTPSFKEDHQLKENYIALLPGSRKQEVSRLLPLMVEVADIFDDEFFVVAGVNNLPSQVYNVCLGKPNIQLIFEENYNVLQHAKAAIVTSGTATLETALFNVPQVVIYKTSPVSYFIGSRLVEVEFFSLVNLIAGKEVVEELLQDGCNFETLSKALSKLLETNHSNWVKEEYQKIRDILGNENTSEKTAELMVKYLQEKH